MNSTSVETPDTRAVAHAAAPREGAAARAADATLDPRRWLILALVCAGQFMVIVDDTIVNVALPAISSDIGFSERGLAWVVNAYLLTFGGFLLVGGRAADLLGRRRMFALGVGCFTAFSLICGVASSSAVLLGGRGLQGLAGALLSPAALAIILATFPEGGERTKALGIWAGLTGVAAATGVVLGGAIVELLGWRWVFFVNVPVGLAVLALVRGTIPAGRSGARAPGARLDLPGALLVTGGLLLLVFTIVETEGHGWGSARTLGGFALALALLAGFLMRERLAHDPLVPLAVLRRRTVAASNGLMLLAAGAMFSMFFFLTLYMQLVQDWSALRTGLSYVPFSLTLGLFSALSAKAMAARGIQPRVLISAGSVVAAIGFLLLRRIEPGGAYASELLPALMVVAAGLGIAFVPLTTAATTGMGDGTGGLASGLLTTCQQIGGAIGIAALVTIAGDRGEALAREGSGRLEALTGGFHAAFLVAAGLLAVAALLAPLIGRVEVPEELPPAV
jgi:EmrB/QacA subfamily drug resistance transporter